VQQARRAAVGEGVEREAVGVDRVDDDERAVAVEADPAQRVGRQVGREVLGFAAILVGVDGDPHQVAEFGALVVLQVVEVPAGRIDPALQHVERVAGAGGDLLGAGVPRVELGGRAVPVGDHEPAVGAVAGGLSCPDLRGAEPGAPVAHVGSPLRGDPP
jgi:hypothetical protein